MCSCHDDVICIRFLVDFVSHTVLTLLFSFFLLSDLTEEVTLLELYLGLCIFAFFVEELRQMQFGLDIAHYMRVPWNWMDILFIILYAIGTYFRASAVLADKYNSVVDVCICACIQSVCHAAVEEASILFECVCFMVYARVHVVDVHTATGDHHLLVLCSGTVAAHPPLLCCV